MGALAGAAGGHRAYCADVHTAEAGRGAGLLLVPDEAQGAGRGGLAFVLALDVLLDSPLYYSIGAVYVSNPASSPLQVMMEYIVIGGINDEIAHAHELGEFCRGESQRQSPCQ